MNSEFYDNDIYALASKNKTLLSVTIELTTRCNWRCKHCYLPSYVTKGISRECLYELFQDLREMGTFELLFTGVRYLHDQIHWKLLEMLERCSLMLNCLRMFLC